MWSTIDSYTHLQKTKHRDWLNGLAETHFLRKDYIRLVPPAKAKPQRLTTLYLCLQRCIQHPTTLDDHQLCPSSDPEKERKKERKQASCAHTNSSRSFKSSNSRSRNWRISPFSHSGCSSKFRTLTAKSREKSWNNKSWVNFIVKWKTNVIDKTISIF